MVLRRRKEFFSKNKQTNTQTNISANKYTNKQTKKLKTNILNIIRTLEK
jgi:hypothetical protein